MWARAHPLGTSRHLHQQRVSHWEFHRRCDATMTADVQVRQPMGTDGAACATRGVMAVVARRGRRVVRRVNREEQQTEASMVDCMRPVT